MIFSVMTFISAMIICFDLSIIYSFYKQAYQTSHQEEERRLRHKVDTLFQALKSSVGLACTRIEAAEGNLERIEKILPSMTHVKIERTLLPFQKAFYRKATGPMQGISRFGILTYDASSDCISVPSQQTSIRCEEGCLVVTMSTMQGKTLEGILEVHLNLGVIKDFLGPLSTIELAENVLDPKGQVIFFKKMLPSLWTYAQQEGHRSILVGIFVLVVLLGTTAIVFVIYGQTQRKHQDHLKALGKNLLTAEEKANELEMRLTDSHEIHQSAQVSRQAYLKLQTAINTRQKEKAKWITLSLDVIKQSYTNQNLYISEKEQLQIIAQCLAEIQPLSLGLWKPTEQEQVNLKEVVAEILKLFQEKIYKSHITLHQALPDNLPCIPGDGLFIQLLLANIIGKAIHRVPKNGVVSLSFDTRGEAIHLEVKDNGYQGTKTLEKFIKKSFDLFVSDDSFQNICRENGLSYSCINEPSSFNTSCLILPLQTKEAINKNVVQLFSH